MHELKISSIKDMENQLAAMPQGTTVAASTVLIILRSMSATVRERFIKPQVAKYNKLVDAHNNLLGKYKAESAKNKELTANLQAKEPAEIERVLNATLQQVEKQYKGAMSIRARRFPCYASITTSWRGKLRG